MASTVQRYRAKLLFPGNERPPIENGMFAVRDGVIVELGRHAGGDSNDLGNVAIIPGLVNAHTHLEFSDLPGPLGAPGIAFTDWIRLVLQWRSDRDSDVLTGGVRIAAIQSGLHESIESGVAAIGEIATVAWDCDPAGRPPQIVQFLERLGNDPALVGTKVREAELFIQSGEERAGFFRGISPHAPYSVPLDMLRELVGIASTRPCPVAMHLAETQQEIELLRSGTGPFVDLLCEIHAWNPDQFRGGVNIQNFLNLLSKLDRVLIVHGNYLTDSEIAFIARHRESMSVVYCPRTHDFFGHEDYPLRKLLDAGIVTALGTDSRASNPDLNVWRDAQHVWNHSDSVSPREVFLMATTAGATALGLSAAVASIELHRPAMLNTIELASGVSIDDPYAALFESEDSPRPLNVA